MSGQRNFYVVKDRDTLSKIARENGTTVSELMKINGIKNPNKIERNQRIALRKEAACGVQALFLDRDRNPIEGLNYRIEYCNKTVNGKSGKDGKSLRIYTETPEDFIRIRIQRLNNTWKHVATIISDVGNKIVEIKGGHLAVEAKTEKHPKSPDGKKPDPKEKQKPAYPSGNAPKPTTDKKDLGPKTTPSNTPDGKPIAKVEGDIPALDEFLDPYAGGEISQKDIEAAAKEIGCEAGLIYAIARQESAHSSFIKIGSRMVPAILYERHQFRNYTRPNKKSVSPYEASHPDICGAPYARARKNKQRAWVHIKSGATMPEDDVYGPSGAFQYQRLWRAYQLNSDAALMACSWGKFQIMGFNFKAAGFSDVKTFTRAMSRSDAEHIKAFLKFAKSKKVLLNGLQTKNFDKIAEGHNGENWRAINPEYASNIEKFYKEYNAKK
jgi:LysM repeat protein